MMPSPSPSPSPLVLPPPPQLQQPYLQHQDDQDLDTEPESDGDPKNNSGAPCARLLLSGTTQSLASPISSISVCNIGPNASLLLAAGSSQGLVQIVSLQTMGIVAEFKLVRRVFFFREFYIYF
jgi:hypothetical protein